MHTVPQHPQLNDQRVLRVGADTRVTVSAELGDLRSAPMATAGLAQRPASGLR